MECWGWGAAYWNPGLLGSRYGDDPIDAGDGDLLLGSVGPADFEGVDVGCWAQAEVEADVGAGGIAAAGDDVGALADAVYGQEGPGTDGVAAGQRSRRGICGWRGVLGGRGNQP